MNNFLLSAGVLLFVFALSVSTAAAQIDPFCKFTGGAYCFGEFALCSGASCNEKGECGLVNKSAGETGSDSCFIFNGTSCSYFHSCKPKSAGLTSYFSRILVTDYGFKEDWCLGKMTGKTFACMDAPCKKTGKRVKLFNYKTNQTDLIETATCQCYASTCIPIFHALDPKPGNCAQDRSVLCIT